MRKNGESTQAGKKPIVKKWWFWAILILVIAVAGAACGGSGDDEKKDTGKKAAAESDSRDAEKKEEKTEKKEEKDKTDNKEKEATVEEQVILEQNGIKVTLKSLSHDSFMGPELKVLVENTSEQNVTVQTDSVSVNGIMIQSLFSCEVAPGKSANDGISLMNSDLEQAGIKKIQNVELKFHVFDTSSYSTLFDSDTIYIATSLDGTEEQAVDDGGVVLLEQDGIKLTVKEADSDSSFWGADIYIYVENNTDKNITVQAREVSLNGFMVQPYFSCDVAAGKKAYDTITFLENELKENEIKSISNMDISFHIFETSSYSAILDTESLNVSFEE